MWRLISEKLWLIAKDVGAQIKSRGRSLGRSGDSLVISCGSQLEMRWLIGKDVVAH